MVRPKKFLGQHFLRDENIARKIAVSLTAGVPLVLEIGPGTGALTKYLADMQPALDPWFMEIDRESAAYLRETMPEIAGRIIEADFLQYNLDTFPPATARQAEGDGALPHFSVIGNFPYNISSQILFRVLENRHRVTEVVGMFQKEVAERIAAPPGSKTYGILSVLLQAFYSIEYLFTVSEHVFVPPPKVKSAVIRLRRNDTARLACDEELFFRLVKAAFNQRRKTLRNALRGILEEKGALTGSPHPDRVAPPRQGHPTLMEYLDLRAERLSPDDFVRLAAEISTFA